MQKIVMNRLNVQNYIEAIIYLGITRCSCHFPQIAKNMPTSPFAKLYNKKCPIPPPQLAQFNFITLISINKKGYSFEQLVGNTCIKRNYFLTHKTMVKVIQKPSSRFFGLYRSINKSHHRFQTIKNTRKHFNVLAIGLQRVKNKEVNT
jgi:hypothetical protein